MTQQTGLTRIAVDAMGGDYAPAEIVAGAVQAATGGGVAIALVGDPEQVSAELAKHDAGALPIQIVPSDGVVAEGEQPMLAMRQKPKASVIVATGMVKQGSADACVSMGSTGAAMAAAAYILGVINGIDRPALGGPVVGLAPKTVILDVGTNVDCRPSQLVSFAVIGDVFARQLLGVERPRIAMLSVGAEAGKGNRQVKETSELLQKTSLNFVGNVEANDILLDKADVVVCDGFVGNVVMKLSEGFGSALAEHLRTSLSGKLAQNEVDGVAKAIHELSNPAEGAGGGPLLGVNGVSIVGHGSARAESLKRAIGIAKMAVETRFIENINEELGKVREAVGE